MCVFNDITAIERIEIDGATAALIRCDLDTAYERMCFAANRYERQVKGFNGFVGFDEEPLVRYLAPNNGEYVLHIDRVQGGMVLTKGEIFGMSEDLDLEADWVLARKIIADFYELGCEPELNFWH